jgi:thiosulfate/3-mercaptopyruvate sulfurtransferase
MCRLDEMRHAIGGEDTVTWDVRSRAEHTGEDPRQNKRGGHIPGAVHLEWLDLTVPPARSGLLLPPEEMRRKLEAAGITPEKQVLVH